MAIWINRVDKLGCRGSEDGLIEDFLVGRSALELVGGSCRPFIRQGGRGANADSRTTERSIGPGLGGAPSGPSKNAKRTQHAGRMLGRF
jgi:hypothetical protein